MACTVWSALVETGIGGPHGGAGPCTVPMSPCDPRFRFEFDTQVQRGSTRTPVTMNHRAAFAALLESPPLTQQPDPAAAWRVIDVVSTGRPTIAVQRSTRIPARTPIVATFDRTARPHAPLQSAMRGGAARRPVRALRSAAAATPAPPTSPSSRAVSIAIDAIGTSSNDGPAATADGVPRGRAGIAPVAVPPHPR